MYYLKLFNFFIKDPDPKREPDLDHLSDPDLARIRTKDVRIRNTGQKHC